jgi:signal transduction histidine kinase
MGKRAVAVAAVAAIGILYVAAIAADAEVTGEPRGYLDLVTEAALALAVASLGLVVVVRSAVLVVGAIMIGIGLTLALATASERVLALLVEDGHDTSTAVRAGLALGASNWVVIMGLLATLAFLFPTGRPASGRWARVLSASLVAYALTVTAIVLSDEPNVGAFEELPGPFPAVPNWVWIALFAIGWPLTLASLIAAAASVVVRFRRATGVERAQLKWFAWSAAVVPITVAVTAITWELTGEFQELVVGVLFVLCLLLPALAVAIAITRYRLYEIDTVVNRTLVYGALTALLAGVWLGAALLLGVALGSGSPWATAGATAAAAATFMPLRRRIQDTVDRRLDRPRWEALRRIRAFEEAVREGSTDAANVQLVLRGVLGDPTAELHFRLAEDGGLVRSDGMPIEADARIVATPVVSRGREVALLLHDPRLQERPRLVQSVVRASSLTIEIARLQVELRHHLVEIEESRARIVRAGYEERRRLERDLHDGAQQRLVSLGIRLRRIQRGLPPEARVLGPALDGAVDEIGAAIADLRTIAAGVRPPRLDAGLRAALEDLARGMPIPVEIKASIERLPAPVEAAAYFVACEAVTNSVKHGRPTAVRVEATREDDRLQLVITDDGVGGAAPGAGSGLAGLADRVGAHGGRLEIDSRPGAGTRVFAELPCAS